MLFRGVPSISRSGEAHASPRLPTRAPAGRARGSPTATTVHDQCWRTYRRRTSRWVPRPSAFGHQVPGTGHRALKTVPVTVRRPQSHCLPIEFVRMRDLPSRVEHEAHVNVEETCATGPDPTTCPSAATVGSSSWRVPRPRSSKARESQSERPSGGTSPSTVHAWRSSSTGLHFTIFASTPGFRVRNLGARKERPGLDEPQGEVEGPLRVKLSWDKLEADNERV